MPVEALCHAAETEAAPKSFARIGVGGVYGLLGDFAEASQPRTQKVVPVLKFSKFRIDRALKPSLRLLSSGISFLQQVQPQRGFKTRFMMVPDRKLCRTLGNMDSKFCSVSVSC